MTLKTWMKEFYPKSPSSRMTKKQAIEHSLRKWRGLTEANIEKHGLMLKGRFLTEGLDNYLKIDAETCALCEKYLDEKRDYECEKCPLTQFLEEPCDNDFESPYAKWINSGNPRPMIEALKKTLKKNQ